MSSKEWYLLHSKPHKEHQLNSYLQSEGIETFYPTIHVEPINPRAAKMRPYFPRYLFVYVDLEEVGVSTFKWAPGASRLVDFDGTPAAVSDHVIDELRSRIAEDETDDEGNRCQLLQHGDTVHITSGPLAGYNAIFDLCLSGSERVQILLNMVGRLVQVKLNANAIKKQ